MLVALTVENFKSIKERVEFNFVSTKGNEFSDRTFKVTEDFRINTIACLIGPNGSGKTHILEALEALSEVSQKTDVNDICKVHVLDKEYENKPTTIEVLLYNTETERLSRYKLSASKGKVINEELFTRAITPRAREKKIFTRYKNEISFNKDLKSLQLLSDEVSEVVSLIRFSEAFRNEELAFVRRTLYQTLKYETDKTTEAAVAFVEEMLIHEDEDSNFRKKFLTSVTNILKKLDIPVSRIFLKRKDGEDKLVFNHINYSKDMYIDEMAEFYSRGSFNLIGFVLFYNLLKSQGGILLFDEFDSTLHLRLAKKVISMITDADGGRNSQVIFATQNIHLLDESLRRDEIYLLSKNDGLSTSVKRISDFSLRKDAKISSKYFNDEFGGLPKFIEDAK